MKTLEYSHCMIPAISEFNESIEGNRSQLHKKRDSQTPVSFSGNRKPPRKRSHCKNWVWLSSLRSTMNRKEIQRTTQHVYNSQKQNDKTQSVEDSKEKLILYLLPNIPMKKWCREKTLLIKRDIRDWPVDYSVWIASKFKQAVK